MAGGRSRHKKAQANHPRSQKLLEVWPVTGPPKSAAEAPSFQKSGGHSATFSQRRCRQRSFLSPSWLRRSPGANVFAARLGCWSAVPSLSVFGGSAAPSAILRSDAALPSSGLTCGGYIRSSPGATDLSRALRCVALRHMPPAVQAWACALPSLCGVAACERCSLHCKACRL